MSTMFRNPGVDLHDTRAEPPGSTGSLQNRLVRQAFRSRPAAPPD